jgi:glutamine synthetase type III
MILPAVIEDLRRRSDALVQLGHAGVDVPVSLKVALQTQTRLAGTAQERLVALKAAIMAAEAEEALPARTAAFGTTVRQAQESLREVLDQLEENTAAELWPIPVYRELLAPLT